MPPFRPFSNANLTVSRGKGRHRGQLDRTAQIRPRVGSPDIVESAALIGCSPILKILPMPPPIGTIQRSDDLALLLAEKIYSETASYTSPR
jgi:hypothetical protein